MKICINNPNWYSLSSKEHYLGARFEFVTNYCDYVYFTPENFIRWVVKNDKKFVIQTMLKKKFIFSKKNINKSCHFFITLNEPSYKWLGTLEDIEIKKIVALYDYNYEIEEIVNQINLQKVDGVILHGNQMKECRFYSKYMHSYKGRQIISHFGFREKYNYTGVPKTLDFSALGAIAEIKERSVSSTRSISSYLRHFKALNKSYSHEYRNWLRLNRSRFGGNVAIELPDPKIGRLTQIDEADVLLRSRSTFIDCGSLNFLPSRFFEALASGTVPIVNIDLYYQLKDFPNELKFIVDDFNLMDLKRKIANIRENYDYLQPLCLKYAQRLTHQEIAKNLKEDLVNAI